MESDRFDGWTRTLGSRRSFGLALGAATLLGISGGASARRTNRKNCKRHANKICTGEVCGKRKNNCDKTFHCTCKRGQICLPNGGCGLACPTECPQECACPATGDQVCVRSELSCELTPRPCATMADCPEGTVCAETTCGPSGAGEKRCVPLCHPIP